MATKKAGGKIARSSITGKFVTLKHAKTHPRTTQIERIKRRGKR